MCYAMIKSRNLMQRSNFLFLYLFLVSVGLFIFLVFCYSILDCILHSPTLVHVVRRLQLFSRVEREQDKGWCSARWKAPGEQEARSIEGRGDKRLLRSLTSLKIPLLFLHFNLLLLSFTLDSLLLLYLI